MPWKARYQTHYQSIAAAVLIALNAAVASAQTTTIPERVAKGEVLSTAPATPSGLAPSVASLLDSTDVLVTGRVGKGRSYVSDDQTEIFTDFPLEDATVLFQRVAATSNRPGPQPPISVTQRGGTVAVDGHTFTQKEGGLPPLQPGTQVLCLLNHVRAKYQIAGWYWGVFVVEDGKLRPLVTRDDFAPDYRGIALKEAVQSMMAILQKSPAKGDQR